MTTPTAATDHPDGTRTYTALNPATKKLVELPNITGIIGLADPKHITDWKLKMGLLGAALREDIAVQIAAANLLPAGPPRNKELRRVAELAITAGQIIENGRLSGDWGSAWHALTECLDVLVPPGRVDLVDELGLPRTMAEIARAYVAAMAAVEVVLSEFSVVSFTHGYAGTSDRVIRFQPLDAWAQAFDQYRLGDGCFVLDCKFGKVHDQVAMQLAAVTVADGIYDTDTDTVEPLPADLRHDIGFVFNQNSGLIPVDLTGAADAFLGLVALKRWGGVKPLHPPLAPTPGPTHVAEVLPKVIASIPDDPFAGLPTDDGTLRPDVTVKRAWLVDRIETLRRIEGGVDAVAKLWPSVNGVPVPTFKQADHHTLDQLALIEQAVNDAERAVRAPFNDPDPTDPANILVPTSDPRVTSLVARGRALPLDLEVTVHAELHEASVPRLTGTRPITAAHLAAAEQIIAAQEPAAEARAERIANALTVAAEHDATDLVLFKALEVPDARHITDRLAGVLDDLVDAIAHPDRVIVERGGQLIVDQPAAVLAAHGSNRSTLLAAGRKAAVALGVDSPKDSDTVLSSPLLTAAVLAV